MELSIEIKFQLKSVYLEDSTCFNEFVGHFWRDMSKPNGGVKLGKSSNCCWWSPSLIVPREVTRSSSEVSL